MSAREVVVFFTGGTIGMDAKPDGIGIAPGNHQKQIFASLPAFTADVHIKPIIWADLPSPHITPEIMLRLSHDLDAHLNRPEVLGAIVLHGTDLMAETAFMLELTLISPKPVVVTGAMLHLAQTDYDGIRNLENGLAVCLAAGSNRGVLLQMAGEIFQARDAVKIDSTAMNPLLAQRRGHVGRVVNQEAVFFQTTVLDTRAQAALPKPITALAERVELLKCFPGMTARCLDHLLDNGLQGLVLEGFGAGNAPPALVSALQRAVDQGVATILTTRCLFGGVHPVYAYAGGGAQLLQTGLINGHGLTGDKALLLLKAALGCGCDHKAIAELCVYYGCS
jgi:L-asparaginase